MANWVLRRRVDLKGIGVQTPGMLNAVTGDARAHTWEVELNSSNAPADLTGYSAYAKVIRYGETIEIPATITGNVVSAILPQACYAYEGTHPCLMRIVNTSTGASVVVDAVLLTVGPGETSVAVDPGTVVPNIDTLLAQIAAMEAATSEANDAAALANAKAALADTATTNANNAASAANAGEAARSVFEAWNSAKAYVVGNRVAKDGSSYVCIAPNTNQAPPNATYWLLIAAKGDNTTAAAVSTGDGSNVQAKLDAHASQLAADAKSHTLAQELTGAYDGVDLTVRFASEIAAYGGNPWAWIKARVQAENFEGLHVHDYIPVTCENPGAYVLKPEIAGINTYKGAGSPEIPAHIDFITKDCWPDTVTYNPVNYNNGIGLDKFTGDGTTKIFQLARREVGYPTLASVAVGAATMTAGTDYTYDAETGTLTFMASPANAAVIKATWSTPIAIPFLASNAYAYMNSLRMGVPNEAAGDPSLTEVDYTNGGIYKWLPAALKAVISPKHAALATRTPQSTLRTQADNYAWADVGPLWLPEEMEVCGSPLFATGTYDKWFARQYPAFMGGNRRKGTGNGGSRTIWWLLPAYSGSSTYFCYVHSFGAASTSPASASNRVPVGFRILADIE